MCTRDVNEPEQARCSAEAAQIQILKFPSTFALAESAKMKSALTSMLSQAHDSFGAMFVNR